MNVIYQKQVGNAVYKVYKQEQTGVKMFDATTLGVGTVTCELQDIDLYDEQDVPLQIGKEILMALFKK